MSDPVSSPSTITPAAGFLARVKWEKLLLWGGLLCLIYLMRHLLFVGFMAFVFCYVIRRIVTAITGRIPSASERPWLEKVVTAGVFLGLAASLYGVGHFLGPRVVSQSRSMIGRLERIHPYDEFQRLLDRTVGAYLFRDRYGKPGDKRYDTALAEYQEKGLSGAGLYKEFPLTDAHLEAAFESDYEHQSLLSLETEPAHGALADTEFRQWFLTTKAPNLFDAHREKYLADWNAGRQSPEPAESQKHDLQKPDGTNIRDEQIRQRIFDDVRADPVTLKELRSEWEQQRVAEAWQELRSSSTYQSRFQDWYKLRHKANPGATLLSYEEYVALKKVRPEGKAAFLKVLKDREKIGKKPTPAQEQHDFELSIRSQLAANWWAKSPAAASAQQHVREELPKILGQVSGAVKEGVGELLKLPVHIATALLLSVLITLDMSHLKKGVGRLRESRLGPVYNELAPGLTAFAALMGRSFEAQAVIAFFNAILSAIAFWLIGVDNELILCALVFVCSFIPVLGVILSAIPVVILAILQPGGSVGLAVQAVIAIGVIHLIESSVLNPRIMGRMLHLHPVLVLGVLLIAEEFFGMWGLILGVPVAVYVIQVVILDEGIPGIVEKKPAAERSSETATV